MLPDIQKWALRVGKTGCYYLCILDIASDEHVAGIDVLAYAPLALSTGWIDIEMTMLRPDLVLGQLTGRRWQVLKAGPGHELPLDYELKPNEYEILRFERPLAPGERKTNETAHFNRGKGFGPMDKTRILWDPFEGSLAVTAGKIVSRRIIRRLS